ncbi:MAG: DUF342 domain-containing protein [Syntrophobacteraceae bacterium]|nr:DUF342 domain-containing protein [Syntrophobacteraceae bacterium]
MNDAPGSTVHERKTARGRHDDVILARLAVQQRFVTEQQVQEALSLQQAGKKAGKVQPLRDILLDRKWITRKQLDALILASTFLAKRKPDRAFGRLAVGRGLITQDQLDTASRTQARIFRETKVFRSVADLLVERELLTAQDKENLLAALRRPQSPPPSTPPNDLESKPSKPRPVPEELAEPEIESETAPSDTILVIEDQHFDVLVSQDGLRAYLRIKVPIAESFTVEEMRSALLAKGIVHGILEDPALDLVLRQPASSRQVWRIAQGKSPTPGKDGQIRYCFPTRSGGLAPLGVEGKVDFKDRGEIPQVKKGDVLAEKIPRIPEIPGMDVYGNEIPVEKSRDVTLLCGSGTEISPDRRQVAAKIDGLPQLTVLGKLSVLPELIIPGDVNFETGNVEYQGKITVHGVVQDGFRVKGSALVAREIGKAQLDISGDVVVYGGILGAALRCQGNVNAVHIYDSRIEAMGNVVVDKGIVDSKIATSGKCVCHRGAIVSSRIIAKKGIETAQVGLERSTPSVLVIGIDPVAEREIDRLKKDLSRHEAEKAKQLALIRPLQEQDAGIELRIGELAQVQDRTAIEQKQVEQEIHELRERKDRAQLAQAEEYLKELEASIQPVAEELDRLFQEQDGLRAKIAAHRAQIREIEQTIQDIRNELSALSEWNSTTGRPPSVQVHGLIRAGTTVKGVFSSFVFKEDARHVRVKEGRVSDAGTDPSGKNTDMRLYVTSLAQTR